jgi:hypothetical protein
MVMKSNVNIIGDGWTDENIVVGEDGEWNGFMRNDRM